MAGTSLYSDGGIDPDTVELPPRVWYMDAGDTAVEVRRIWVFDANANATIVFEAPGELSAPTNLTVDPSGDQDLEITWTLQTSTEDRVVVEYSDDEGSTWSHLTDLAAGTESHIDDAGTAPTLTDGQRRDYRAKVERDDNDGTKDSAYSNTDWDVTSLDAPVVESATSTSATTIEVDIAFGEDWDAIEIYRNESGGSFSLLDTINDPGVSDFPYEDSGLNTNTQYCYKMKGVGPDETTGFSNTECATTSAPAAETLRPNADVGGTMNAIWTDTDGNGDGWDELDEASPDDGTTVISASVQDGNADTVSHAVVLTSPTETHDDSQTWTVQVRVKFTHTSCGAGGNYSVTLNDRDSSFTRTESLSHSDDTWQTRTFTLTTTEINAISNTPDFTITLEATISSPCCSNCSTQFPIHGSEAISWSQAELDIS